MADEHNYNGVPETEGNKGVLARITARPEWPGLEEALRRALRIQGKELALDDKGTTVWCLCPGHDDHHPSLSLWVNELTGALWFKCHAGCSSGHILDRLGLKASEVKGEAAGMGGRRPVATYNYVSALSGEVVYRKVRYEPKGFSLQHTPDKGRTWLKGRGQTRLLYRLDLIAGARSEGRPVWLCEGEKDADTAWREYGAVGTTNDDGATNFKEDDATALINMTEVVVVPDRDGAGAKRLRQVWELMRKVAPGVVVRLLTVPPPYKDLTELHEAGFGQAEVTALISERGIVEHDVAEFERVANDKLLELIETYIYAIHNKRYVDVRSKVMRDGEQLDMAHAVDFGLGAQERAHRHYQLDPRARKVETITYLPGGETLLTDPEGLAAVNVWRPSSLRPADGPVDWWLDHLKFLIPNEMEREVLLDWCAFLIQRPQDKCNWCVFMGSQAERLGKDSFFVPVIRALGEHNHVVVSPGDVASGSNWYLERAKLVVISEVESSEKIAVTNRIKSQLTTPPFKLPVNVKYMPNYQVPNIATYLGFSNRQDALWLDPGDKRFLVLWSDSQPREPDYYVEYYRNVAAHSGAVYRWLLDRDLSRFNPKMPTMTTKAKEDMIAITRPPLVEALLELIEAAAPPFNRSVITVEEVRDALENGVIRLRTTPSLNKVRIQLKALGFVCLGQGTIYPERLLAEGVPKYELQKQGKVSKPRLWAKRSIDGIEELSTGTVATSAAVELYLEELRMVDPYRYELIMRGANGVGEVI